MKTMIKIARVFPTRTSMSPVDEDSYYGQPGLFVSQGYKEIHISVAFTWDIEKANWLKEQWEMIAPVKIGGPAIDGEPTNGFVSGMYLKKGITITSRGCPNRCPWCFVNTPIKELDLISVGNVIQDNNILACSKSHLDKVFQMLSRQHSIRFLGGLESKYIKYNIVERLRSLNIKELWLSYDHDGAIYDLTKASYLLRKYFKRYKLRCYVLIGFRKDTIKKAEKRLVKAWELGFLPFAMLYRNKQGDYPKPEKEWRHFQRTWTRPAAMATKIKELLK